MRGVISEIKDKVPNGKGMLLAFAYHDDLHEAIISFLNDAYEEDCTPDDLVRQPLLFSDSETGQPLAVAHFTPASGGEWPDGTITHLATGTQQRFRRDENGKGLLLS